MASQGYIRYPDIYQDRIVFVAEDDLWLVGSAGGQAERLTAGVGEVSHPRFSPDGKQLAFVGREEGPTEVYVMATDGSSARRLTFQAQGCLVLGWSLDGSEILYTTCADQVNNRFYTIFAVNPDGGLPRQLNYGLADAIALGPHGSVVLGRNNFREAAFWKRYRGGTAGYLWCDAEGNGIFKRLLDLNSNIASPCWIGNRVYFLSDHEGVGNIYSCTPNGEDIRQHSDHQDFYARNLAGDGKHLVYHAGGDLYLFDPAADKVQQVKVELPSTRTQRNRKFVSAAGYLDTYALHPQGHKVSLSTRGKAFSLGNWEGPVLQHGERDGVRYRFLEWLNDGKRLVAICDAPGHETLTIFDPDNAGEPEVLSEIEFGRANNLAVSPTADVVAITNHRNELLTIDLTTKLAKVLDSNNSREMMGMNWSPDGRWLAYGCPLSNQQTAIKLCNIESGETHQITNPILHDINPAFDPEGKYLYFIGYRSFSPVYDNLHFDLGFPHGTKPYAIMLQSDLRSPFIAVAKTPEEKAASKTNGKNGKADDTPKADEAKDAEQDESKKEAGDSEQHEPTLIDLDGIADRVQPFPVREGIYESILGIKGKALFLSRPSEPASALFEEGAAKGTLEYYNFDEYKTERLFDSVSGFDLSRDNKTLIYRSRHKLRVVKAGEKPKAEHDSSASRESGWLDLNRVKVSVQPSAEWKQMFAEAWRLQRENFWVEDMSGIDWDAIYAQYAPLVERVSSRQELSDLFWEVQGELGTSHAYEMGGEYRQRPNYQQGNLAVNWSYEENSGEAGRYRIAAIAKGDPSNNSETSPLMLPGLNVKVGDAVLAVNGQLVGPHQTPPELLVNQANQEVQLTIEDAESKEIRSIVVKAIADDKAARYRDWVEQNRKYVHEHSQGRVGYIHIPDMIGSGFAEFHRSFLMEYEHPGLLVDVRWNRGGHVSGLLLEKLARRRIGYGFSRWGQPGSYPDEAPQGAMVALTDEHAGSDGDIFSHSFKLMGLGPLIGKRTWGGVIGINPRHKLVDGTMTTQPEYSFWFKDVGWGVENYGTDPDIEIDIAPQDFANNVDPQLERALAEALRMIEANPPLEAKPGPRPRLGRTKK